jgi:hypothetical protein
VYVTDLFLNETPIEDLSLIGDWSRNSSFRNPKDRALLTNPKAQAKIIHKWEKTVVPFNIYFINSPEANRPERREVGEVHQEWLMANLPQTFPLLKLRDDAVNILYTNNVAAEWAPMTAWITAHRFAHVTKALPEFDHLCNKVFITLKFILASAYREEDPRYGTWEKRQIFDKMLTKFCELIGTFRSAREHQIRSPYEFVYELIAQYMITGKITFNPVPRGFGHGRQAWGRPTNHASISAGHDNECNQRLGILAWQVTDQCKQLLHACVGRTFVM